MTTDLCFRNFAVQSSSGSVDISGRSFSFQQDRSIREDTRRAAKNTIGHFVFFYVSARISHTLLPQIAVLTSVDEP